MPGIGSKVVHVLTNNMRRRRLACRLCVLIAIACLTILLGPRFYGRMLRGEGGEGGGTEEDDTEEIQMPQVPPVVATPLYAVGQDVLQRRVTPPPTHPGAANGLSIPTPIDGRQTPPTNHNSTKQAPSAQSPYNPCGLSAFLKRPPEDLSESFEWQRISAEATNTYVFAAHLDTRGSRRAIVIVGISSDYMAASVNYACQIWFAKSTEAIEVTSAAISTHSETHARKYAATFYTCNYQSNESLPFAVSLVTFESRCGPPSNVLRISPFDRSKDPVVNFTVCVTPLNYDFNDSRLLVEMVELNRMFGAQRFVFYNFTTGSEVVPYMRSYAEDGVVTVLPWKLPVLTDARGPHPDPEIHYFGQLAALNDCLYRSMFRSRYVVLTDMDEIVVPRRQGTWIEMMESEGKARRSDWQSGVASFHFRNVFFRTDYGVDDLYVGNATVRGLQLRSLLFTIREQTTFPHGWRSKHIVNPEAVVLVGVHHIENNMDYNRFSVFDVGEEVGLLYHYRSWAGEETSRQPSKTDRFMHAFNQTILTRVEIVHRTVASKFKGVATIEELTTNRTHS